MTFMGQSDNWIKRKIFLATIFKNIEQEIDTKYLRFYQSIENNDNIFIFLLRLGYIEEDNIIEEVVREVIEPISDTLIYAFCDKKHLTARSQFDYSANLSVPGYDIIRDDNFLGFELPSRMKIKDIYKLYKLLNQNGKTNKSSKTR